MVLLRCLPGQWLRWPLAFQLHKNPWHAPPISFRARWANIMTQAIKRKIVLSWHQVGFWLTKTIIWAHRGLQRHHLWRSTWPEGNHSRLAEEDRQTGRLLSGPRAATRNLSFEMGGASLYKNKMAEQINQNSKPAYRPRDLELERRAEPRTSLLLQQSLPLRDSS